MSLPHFSVVLADEACELGRGIGDQLDPLRTELALEIRAVQDLDHLAVDLHQDLGRGLRRYEKTEPWIEGIAGNGLRDGRRVAEQAKPSILHVRQDGVRRPYPDLDAAREQVGDRRCGALVRHVVHLGAGEQLEHRRAQMLRAAVSGRTEVQLTGFRLRQRDQLLHRLRRHVGIHHQQELDARDLRYGQQIRERIERLLAEVRIDRKHVVGREQPGVAVGRALRHEIRTDVLAAAGAVFDHHRVRPDALQVLGERPGDSVGRPAGGERHDDPDRSFRKALRCSKSREKRDQSSQQPSAHCNFSCGRFRAASLPIRTRGIRWPFTGGDPHADPRGTREAVRRRIAVPVADPGAVRLERRVHAAAAERAAKGIRSAREGHRRAHGEEERHRAGASSSRPPAAWPRPSRR